MGNTNKLKGDVNKPITVTKNSMVMTNIATIIAIIIAIVGGVLFLFSLKTDITNRTNQNATEIQNLNQKVETLVTDFSMIEDTQIELISTLSRIDERTSRIPIIEKQVQELAKKNN